MVAFAEVACTWHWNYLPSHSHVADLAEEAVVNDQGAPACSEYSTGSSSVQNYLQAWQGLAQKSLEEIVLGNW